jgi:hypothetical protein
VAHWSRLSPLAAIAALLCIAAPQAGASDSFYVNASDERPLGVDATRLYDLADQSARHWKLSVAGNAGQEPGVRDGIQVLGFSRKINAKALGVTSVWTRARYKIKSSRVCTRVNGKRRCRDVRRYVRSGTDVVERDTQLNPFVTWQQGPGYPSTAEYDLQSTILHELGHFANPLKDMHVFGCENSPMIASIAPGEFWHASDDWLRFGCSQATGPKFRRALPAGPALPMLVVEHRLPAKRHR